LRSNFPANRARPEVGDDRIMSCILPKVSPLSAARDDAERFETPASSTNRIVSLARVSAAPAKCHCRARGSVGRRRLGGRCLSRSCGFNDQDTVRCRSRDRRLAGCCEYHRQQSCALRRAYSGCHNSSGNAKRRHAPRLREPCRRGYKAQRRLGRCLVVPTV
jgi:hypothetical protein